MNIPKFGLITNADIQPGKAIAFDSSNINKVFVVKTVEGTERHLQGGHRKTGDGEIELCSATIKDYTADVYTRQKDGGFLKTREEKTPVSAVDDDKNPYFKLVDVKIDGDRLELVG